LIGSDLLKPKSVAVIGASAKPGKIGFSLIKNLLDGQFPGKIYPINYNEKNILGLKCYPSVQDVVERIELAIIATPAQTVPEVIEECGYKKIGQVIIISAGFAEIGAKGKKLQEQILEVAERNEIRILGPNCLGVISPINRLNASFSLNMPDKKNIAVLSQSGATCTAILDWANLRGVGFSHFVSLGNKADLNENDFVEFFAHDPNTKVVLGYLESISSGPKFLHLAKKLTQEKPFILLKAGRSEAGQKAARSHTAAMSSDDLVLTEALQEAGVIRAENLGDLFEWSMVFSEITLPEKEDILIITNAGGPAVMAADEIATKHHLKFYKFSQSQTEKIESTFENRVMANNPLDLLGDATSKEFSNIFEILKNKKDKTPDFKIVLITPQSNTDIDNIAKVIADNSDHRTVVVFIGGKSFDNASKILAEAKIPTFLYPEEAVTALDQLSRYGKYKKEKTTKQKYTQGLKKAAEKLIARNSILDDANLAKLLAAYQIPMADSKLTANVDEAIAAAERFGYPVVLKVTSPDILHKTEAGAVKLGISSEDELKSAYQEILTNAKKHFPEANILGVTVYHMIRSSVELAFGAKRDPIFGPVIMFGMGGIYIEVLNDFRIRLAPVSLEEAHNMMERIRSYKLLLGYRNTEKFDLDAIAKAISGLSALMIDFPNIKEVDINPIRLAKDNGGIVALDAKVVFDLEKSE